MFDKQKIKLKKPEITLQGHGIIKQLNVKHQKLSFYLLFSPSLSVEDKGYKVTGWYASIAQRSNSKLNAESAISINIRVES